MTTKTYGRICKEQMCDFSKYQGLFNNQGYVKQKKESPWQGILVLTAVIAFVWLFAYTAQVYGIN